MNDVATGFVEREQGPSWARPNWPVSELDDLNLGLDPTQATIEKFAAAVKERAAAAGATPDEIRRAAACAGISPPTSTRSASSTAKSPRT
jgi:2-oxoglutarate dehydrogenase E1 component